MTDKPSFIPADLGTSLPKPRGTPRKFTPERRRNYLMYLSDGYRRSVAAKKAGVNWQAVSGFRRADPKFAAEEVEAEIVGLDRVEEALYNTALGGNVTALIYVLGNRAPERWKDVRHRKVEVEGTITHEIEAGDSISRITGLLATLEERKALRSGADDADVIDVEELDDDEAPAS